MPIKAITFDFWGTLYHGSGGREVRMQRLVDVVQANGYRFEPQRYDEADRVAWSIWERVWREECRTLSSGDWLRIMFDHLAVTLPPETIRSLAHFFSEAILHVDPPLRLVDGAADAVRRLGRRYRLGLISDTGLSDGRTLRKILTRDDLLDCFGCPTFSDEIGVSKPHPDPFRRTLACLGAQPAEAVHVGDLTRTDVGGAKSIGMRAVRFTGVSDDADDSIAPDAVVSTYVDLERLIRDWDEQV